MGICCLYGDTRHSNCNIYQFGHLLTMFLLLVVAAHLSSTCLSRGILSHIIMKWSLILIDNKKAIIQQLDENIWNFHGKTSLSSTWERRRDKTRHRRTLIQQFPVRQQPNTFNSNQKWKCFFSLAMEFKMITTPSPIESNWMVRLEHDHEKNSSFSRARVLGWGQRRKFIMNVVDVMLCGKESCMQ